MLKRLRKDGYKVIFDINSGNVLACGPMLSFFKYECFETVTKLYNRVYDRKYSKTSDV